MAKSGRRPPDLRGSLGSLVQSALEQVGVVREVVERGAQAQRTRLDALKLERRRRDAMAQLGEVIYNLAMRGRLGELADDPDVRAQLEDIDTLDQRIDAAESRGASGFRANAGVPASTARRKSRAAKAEREPMRVWRPVPPFAAGEAHAHPDDDLDDDPRPPSRDDAVSALRGRGISFNDRWDDDDLEDYMHEDDVPPPPTPATKPAAKPAAKPRKRRGKSQKK
jgi:hypothetical protein